MTTKIAKADSDAIRNTPVTLANALCKADDGIQHLVNVALSLKIVTADGSDPDADAVDQFKCGVVAYYDKHVYKAIKYNVLSEADGKIEVCANGAASLTVGYVTALSPSDLGKIKGTRGDLTTLKGIVCDLRDAVSRYVSQKYSRLANRALTERGPKAAKRDFWTFVDDELAKIVKRARTEKVASDAELKVASAAFMNALKGNNK
jgi:hypothetical protein